MEKAHANASEGLDAGSTNCCVFDFRDRAFCQCLPVVENRTPL